PWLQEVDLPLPPPPPLPLPPTLPPLVPLVATDVTEMVQVRTDHKRNHGTKEKVTLKNRSGTAIQGPLSLVLGGLDKAVSLRNAAGFSLLDGSLGCPYATTDLPELRPGKIVTLTLFFNNPKHHAIHFKYLVMAGTGIV